MATLAWLGVREVSTRSARQAELRAYRVGPATAAYRVLLGGSQVGFATHLIDTIPGSIRIDEVWDLDLPVRAGTRKLLLSSSALLSRRVELREWQVGLPLGRLRADVGADSTVRAIVPRGSSADTTVSTWVGEPVPPSGAALAMVASGELAVGRSVTVGLLNPVTLVPRATVLRILAESTFTIPDSVVYDSTARRWRAVRNERLPGWLVDPDGPGGSYFWIDAQGEVIDAVLPFGISLTRTMFELAKDNYRAEAPPVLSPLARGIAADFVAWVEGHGTVRSP